MHLYRDIRMAELGTPPPSKDLPDVSITWKPAGPIVVEGPVRVLDNEGNELVPPPTKVPGQIKFCGCGRSGTKPFCDGSHKC